LQEESITKDVEFLVLASDGLWDVVSNQVCFGTFSVA
jgi:serine/threonine protein phosphatase PrpC